MFRDKVTKKIIDDDKPKIEANTDEKHTKRFIITSGGLPNWFVDLIGKKFAVIGTAICVDVTNAQFNGLRNFVKEL